MSEWRLEQQEESWLEACIDELDAAIAALDRFPETMLAFALRAHLAALLDTLASRGEIGEVELRSFLDGLVSEFQFALQELPAGVPASTGV